MVEVIVYFDCALCIIDFITISAVRSFLFDFLIDRKNRKSAKRFHMQQSVKNRITLAYILPLLKNNASKCQLYQTLYMSILYTLVPQYAIILACNIIMQWNSIYVLAVFALIKIVIALIIRVQTDSNLVSQYRRK